MSTQAPARKRGILFWITRGLFTIVILVVALLVLGFGYEALAESNDQRAYPPLGELVDIGGYRLHLYCLGEGSPTVILDALQPGTVSDWVWVQPEVARTTRVCAYDRAGLGWSDAGGEPRDALMNTVELHTLLQNAGVTPPYILVGHSLGGAYARVYAGQYPNEVSGMVLIDASHPDFWQRAGLPEGAGLDRGLLALGPLVARFGLLHFISFAQVDPDLPVRQQEELRAFYTTPKFAENSRVVDLAFPDILAQARAVTSLGAIPLVVLTTGEINRAETVENQLLRELQVELSQLSTNSSYRAEDGATHTTLITNQQHAQAVITAISDVLEAARSNTSLATE